MTSTTDLDEPRTRLQRAETLSAQLERSNRKLLERIAALKIAKGEIQAQLDLYSNAGTPRKEIRRKTDWLAVLRAIRNPNSGEFV